MSSSAKPIKKMSKGNNPSAEQFMSASAPLKKARRISETGGSAALAAMAQFEPSSVN